MSSESKRPIGEVLPVVSKLVNLLAPCCTRIAVAGSIRRGEAEVGDIELVCRPAGHALESLLADFIHLKTITKQHKSNGDLKSWGPRYKAFTFWDTPVDLFIVLKDRQWGPTFLIRTGPGSANDALVTREGVTNKNGRVGVLPKGMKLYDAAFWLDEVKLETPEEVDCFEAVGLPYIPPPLRSYELYRALYRGQPTPVFPVQWLKAGDDLYIDGQRKVMTPPVMAEADVVPVAVQQRLL